MTVYKRGHKWVAQVHNPATGRPKQVGTFAKKSEAQAAERAARSRRNTSDITVTELRERWLGRPGLRGSTAAHYRGQTDRFEKLYGDRSAQSITRQLAIEYVDIYGGGSVRELAQMFNHGKREYTPSGEPLLAVNPFDNLGRRQQAKRRLSAGWMSDEDVSLFESCAVRYHGPVYGPTVAGLIRFAAETGMRPGEIFALRDEDIDEEAGVVKVRRAVNRVGIGPPKNGQERQAPLSPRALAAVRNAMRAEGQATIFATPSGKHFTNQSWGRYWHPVRCMAGRPETDTYEMRHYCATRLLEAGLSDYDVSIALGHTDGGELVRKVYGHRSEERALDRVREALGSEGAAGDHGKATAALAANPA